MRKFWTQEEINFLKEYYPTKGSHYCADNLQERTLAGVCLKARSLGLKAPGTLKTNEQYDYELFYMESDAFRIEDYSGAHTPILHECVHGHTWKAQPSSILNGSGCPICNTSTKSHETYQNQVPYKVLDRYVNDYTKLRHECSEGHVWDAVPGNIIRGHGCPKCANYGFDRTSPAVAYYIKITKDNETYYKIGVTNSNVKNRFIHDRDKNIVTLMEKKFATGALAVEYEESILNKFEQHRINVPKWLRSNGNTELFEFDILELDK